MATLNVTHANIESAIKTRANSARNTIQNRQQSLNHKQKSPAFTLKNFSRLIATPSFSPSTYSNPYISRNRLRLILANHKSPSVTKKAASTTTKRRVTPKDDH
jgi:hypothetical protein